jgi:hypothetical protein
MRWAGYVTHMWCGEVFTGSKLGGPKGKDHWENLGVGGRIILRWTLKWYDRRIELDSANSGYSSMAGFYEYGNELSGSIQKAGYSMTSWETIDFSKNILHHVVS